LVSEKKLFRVVYFYPVTVRVLDIHLRYSVHTVFNLPGNTFPVAVRDLFLGKQGNEIGNGRYTKANVIANKLLGRRAIALYNVHGNIGGYVIPGVHSIFKRVGDYL
jgi:hypothetical protein